MVPNTLNYFAEFCKIEGYHQEKPTDSSVKHQNYTYERVPDTLLNYFANASKIVENKKYTYELVPDTLNFTCTSPIPGAGTLIRKKLQFPHLKGLNINI